jgi:hypothetical protein
MGLDNEVFWIFCSMVSMAASASLGPELQCAWPTKRPLCILAGRWMWGMSREGRSPLRGFFDGEVLPDPLAVLRSGYSPAEETLSARSVRVITTCGTDDYDRRRRDHDRRRVVSRRPIRRGSSGTNHRAGGNRGPWIIRTSSPAVVGSPGRRTIGCAASWRSVCRGATRTAYCGGAVRSTRRRAPHWASVGGATICALNGPPGERLRRERRRQSRTQADQDWTVHRLAPFFPDAGGSAGDINSVCTAPSGGWKANSASAGRTEKFQSENSAMKLGWPGWER